MIRVFIFKYPESIGFPFLCHLSMEKIEVIWKRYSLDIDYLKKNYLS
jgi:hypothetical protein